ncbi:MAG: Zn-ribbon domain-containing OB-fold protein [Thermoleophilaceae bacterium]
MIGGVAVAQCIRCGHRVFPDRLGCPVCGGYEWRHVWLHRGTVESVTLVRRAPGRRFDPPVRLATVHLTGGPRVVARLEDELVPGMTAAVDVEGGAVVARLDPA